MNNAKLSAAVIGFMVSGLLAGPALRAAPAGKTLNLANPVSNTTDSLAVSYSPNGSTQAAGIVTVNNGTKTADNRPFCVVFTLTNQGQQGGLTFRVVNTATGAVLSLSGAPGNESQVLSGSFPTGTAVNTNQVFPYAFQVDPTKLPAPGTYTATISQKLYGGSTYPPSGAALDTNTLTVSITVGSHYDVSVVGSGAGFSLASTNQALNFGILAAGGQVAADILVRSNVTYSLSLTSANGGRLVNAEDATSAVAYSVTANGTPVPLSPPPGAVAGGAAATFETPKRYSLLFTILPISDFPSAGAYSDTIIVNLAAP